MKQFVYKGVAYKSEHQVRQAIWQSERKVFGKCGTHDEWAQHDVVYTEVEVKLTQEQIARQVRTKRDALLARCDYYVMPDYPATEEGLAEVKAYRQALRDITKQEGFPDAVTWPNIPDALA